MAQFSLNLPMDIPWKLIAVSPDMMDTQFCNKRFPFQWRSSLAISAFEPKLEDLPEQLCDERITYLKVTASITGYQPTEEETKRGYAEFPDVPTEDLDRILGEYFACWGVLLNVAVFPYGTFKKRQERRRIDFGELQPRQVLPNPYQNGPFTFQATNEPNNRTVDWYPRGGDQHGELNLFREMVVTFPATSQVEAKVIHTSQAITMEVYHGTQLLRSQTTGSQQQQIYDLVVEGEAIDRVIFKAPGNEASLLEFAIYEEVEEPPTLADYPISLILNPRHAIFTRALARWEKSLRLLFRKSIRVSRLFIQPQAKLGSRIPGNTHRRTLPMGNSRLPIQSPTSGAKRIRIRIALRPIHREIDASATLPQRT